MLRKIIKALTLKKRMRIEVIETLCTICLYLESEADIDITITLSI